MGLAGTSVIHGQPGWICFILLAQLVCLFIHHPPNLALRKLCPIKDTFLDRGGLVSSLVSGITEDLHSLQKIWRPREREIEGNRVPLANVAYFFTINIQNNCVIRVGILDDILLFKYFHNKTLILKNSNLL